MVSFFFTISFARKEPTDDRHAEVTNEHKSECATLFTHRPGVGFGANPKPKVGNLRRVAGHNLLKQRGDKVLNIESNVVRPEILSIPALRTPPVSVMR